MKSQTFSVCILLALLFSCAKKHGDTPASNTDPTGRLILDQKATVEPSVVAFSGTAVEKPMMTVAGQLVLATPTLTSSIPDKVLAVPLYRGNVSLLGDVGNFKDIKSYDVNQENGRFTVDFSRIDPFLSIVTGLLAKSDSELTDELVANQIPVTVIFGSNSDPSAPTRTLLENVKSVCESGNGRSYMLVGMTSSPAKDVEAEAASMRFIGMPAGSASLMMFFPPLAKGHVLYGDVKIGLGDDIQSVLPADNSVFDIPTTSISEIAWVSRSLKGIKNAYMNYNPDTKGIAVPEMRFSWTAKGIPAAGTFLEPQSYVYQGFGTRVTVSNVPNLTVANICNAATGRLKLYPPTTIDMGMEGSVSPQVPYDSGGTGAPSESDGGGQYCKSSQKGKFEVTFYNAGPNLNTAELGWGGSSSGDVPDGFWRLTFDGNVIARFDVGMAAPQKSGVILVPVPVFRVVTDSSGTVTSLDVKFFFETSDKKWIEVTDVSILDRIGMVYEGDLSSKTKDANHLFSPTHVGNVLRFSSDKFGTGPFTAPGTSSDSTVTGASISYSLFGQNYTFQLQ